MLYSIEEVSALCFQQARIELLRLFVVPEYSTPARYTEQVALRLVEAAKTDEELGAAIDVARPWLTGRATREGVTAFWMRVGEKPFAAVRPLVYPRV